jgi:hypothetical protein
MKYLWLFFCSFKDPCIYRRPEAILTRWSTEERGAEDAYKNIYMGRLRSLFRMDKIKTAQSQTATSIGQQSEQTKECPLII